MSVLAVLLSLLLFPDLLLLSSANSITLSLSRILPPTTNPRESLKYHAAASQARANLLAYPNSQLPLSPRRYGAYSVNLSFGTPPQTLRLIMDTGYSLVWFPCTHNFNCPNCLTHTLTFIPESSSSYQNITCTSPQCKWLQDSKCNNNHNQCGYRLEYGLGYTQGRLLSENLTFPGLSANNFIVGCSVSSTHTPDGVVGFGRAKVSLPAQLGLTSFSYCLVSNDLLNTKPTGSSDLVLTATSGGEGAHAEIKYTPFVSNTAYPDYYYVSLQSISIGGVHINVPAKYLVLDAKGNGGTIVDSGSTLTQMEQPVFDLVVQELEKQVGNTYSRAKAIENETGLEPCYNVPVGVNQTKFPQLTFYFRGDMKMDLPLPNYFAYVDKSVVCLAIMNSGKVEPGPAIVVGNYQQQNYYMKYDLENNRLGIVPQNCG